MQARDKRKRKRIFAAVRISVTAVAAFAIALCNALCPFKTMLPAYALPARQEGEMRLHFVDVGQGDCTIVEFPEGDLLVVDGGDGGWKNENNLFRYVNGLHPASVSVLVSHADYDHFGGLTEFIECFGADAVYLPAVEGQTASYRAFAEAAERSGAELQTLSRYDVIAKESGAYAVCLSPYSLGETDGNDSSTVLFVSYSGVNAVLCGDISAEREEKLVRESGLDEALFDSGEYRVRLGETDILKVAHHGSANSSSADWLSLLSPETAIVSCGKGNYYAHPAGETVERLARIGAEIYRTDELGNLIVSISNGKYVVSSLKDGGKVL